jgi:hypothetical protein
MLRDAFPTTAEIQALFAEQITAAGGTVADTFDDGARLFTRSLLPAVREVQKGDQVQGGVALRAAEADVWVHPYVFRLVCRNGAIRAHALQTRHVEAHDCATPEEAAGAIRAAVVACCAADAFAAGAEEMRSAHEHEADLALNLLPLLAHLPSETAGQLFQQIMDRFNQGADRSRFGLMNAVTALARDTRDPETRWRLEELGGGIPLGHSPMLPPNRTAAKAELVAC